MLQKESLIQQLRKVKLVLGNGFDLYCGLKTEYKDYFGGFRKDKYLDLANLINNLATLIYNESDRREDPDLLPIHPRDCVETNCWDVFFSIAFNKGDNHLWCDVEKEMLESFVGRDNKRKSKGDYKPHWEDVYEYLRLENIDNHCAGSLILAAYYKEKFGKVPASRDEFYETLLNELKIFEMDFGYFITRQHIRYNGFQYVLNSQYIAKASDLLSRLGDSSQIVSIDCFNYGFMPLPQYYDRCNFINGDCLNPIFGIDSVFTPDQWQYIFTKTNRRIEWDINKSESSVFPEFDNAIVFGHSLSLHDHNYFFPILDQLEMTNFASKKRFIFAYTIHKPEEQLKIKQNVRKAIYTLFTEYAKYVGKEAQASRFLDSLTAQGRVITYEIPFIPNNTNRFYSEADLVFKSSIREVIKERWQVYLNHAKN